MTRKASVRLPRTFVLTLALALPAALSLSACGGDENCEEEDKDVLGQCPDDGEGEGDDGADDGADDGDDGGGAPTFTGLYDDHLNKCGVCHAPGGAGFIAGQTEATLNFADRNSAYTSITTGKASGLVGNFAGCNEVAFIGASAGASLIVAVLDEDVRAAYDNPAASECNGNGSISDMSGRTLPPVPSSITAGLKSWIDAGASND